MTKLQKQEKIKAEDYYVVKSNATIQRSQFDLTLNEQKAVLYMLSKIKRDDKPNTEYVFDIKDFCQVCGFNTKSGYYTIRAREILESIASKPLVITLNDGTVIITHWFGTGTIKPDGTITIDFPNKIKPFLFELHSCFTGYKLEMPLSMKTKYGIRLYEYLKSIGRMGINRRISLEDLRERLGCRYWEQDAKTRKRILIEEYTEYRDFKKRVLEPAMKDINTYSDIKVTYVPIKTGRQVTHIEFNRTALSIEEAKARTNNRGNRLALPYIG